MSDALALFPDDGFTPEQLAQIEADLRAGVEQKPFTFTPEQQVKLRAWHKGDDAKADAKSFLSEKLAIARAATRAEQRKAKMQARADAWRAEQARAEEREPWKRRAERSATWWNATPSNAVPLFSSANVAAPEGIRKARPGSLIGDIRWQKIQKVDATAMLQAFIEWERRQELPRHGKSAIDLLRTLIFKFWNWHTGRLDPSYLGLAAGAELSRSNVHTTLQALKDLGVITWIRRASWIKEKDGSPILKQDTNAYFILPPSHWKGYQPPPPANDDQQQPQAKATSTDKAPPPVVNLKLMDELLESPNPTERRQGERLRLLAVKHGQLNPQPGDPPPEGNAA